MAATLTITEYWMRGIAAPLILLAACSSPGEIAEDDGGEESDDIRRLQVSVIETYPHDANAFTQGLELADGLLYESTGRYGESDVRIVEPTSGNVLTLVELPPEQFGEGLTVTDEAVWQLTWKAGIVYERDKVSLKVIAEHEIDGEGWGICSESEELYVSDGSDTITIRDTATFSVQRTLSVTKNGEAVRQINELECENDIIWANVWQSAEIIGIDARTGKVHTVVDASSLEGPYSDRFDRVLNGIAALGDGTYYLTGKLWPHLFHVRFTE